MKDDDVDMDEGLLLAERLTSAVTWRFKYWTTMDDMGNDGFGSGTAFFFDGKTLAKWVRKRKQNIRSHYKWEYWYIYILYEYIYIYDIIDLFDFF